MQEILHEGAGRTCATVDRPGVVQSAVWPGNRAMGTQGIFCGYRGGATVVMLLPARTDTRWFHDYIYGKAEVRFIRGRLKFGGSKNSAPFPSMVVIFGERKRT